MTVDHVQERTGVITFKGKPMTLLGPDRSVGAPAPAIFIDRGRPIDRESRHFAGRG